MKRNEIDLNKHYPIIDKEFIFDQLEQLNEQEQFLTKILKNKSILFNYYSTPNIEATLGHYKKITYFAYHEKNFTNILSGNISSISFKINNENSIILNLRYTHRKNITNIINLRKLYSPMNINLAIDNDHQNLSICFKYEFFLNLYINNKSSKKTERQISTFNV